MKPISRAANFLQKRDESFLRAKEYFQQAFSWIPPTPPAYAGLSDYFTLTDTLPAKEALPKAKEYAQQALKLDSNFADSHILLAYILFYDDWNWPAATGVRRAIPSLRSCRVSSLVRVYLLHGRMPEAMREAQRAVDLDPLSISAHDAVAIAATCGGHYDQSLMRHAKSSSWTLMIRGLRGHVRGPLAETDVPGGFAGRGKGLAISHRYPLFLSIRCRCSRPSWNMEQASKLVDEMRPPTQNPCRRYSLQQPSSEWQAERSDAGFGRRLQNSRC